jgi:hypothetical protein
MKGIYTVQENALIDQVVKQHLDTIQKALQDLMKTDLNSAVLTGGFGRGEGSAYVDEVDIVHIVNDYDIEVVYKEKWGRFLSKIITHLHYEKKLIRLAEALANDFNMKQVDLSLRGLSSYKAMLTPRLSDYDMKYGNMLIYGNKNPVDLAPQYSPDEIPAFEGTWLLRNRGIGLLLARFYLENNKLRADKREYFYIEITKAILAMGDALFISKGCYNNLYTARAGLIESVLPSDWAHSSELGELYRLASDYKIRPRYDMFSGIEPAQLLEKISSIYSKFILYYESRRLGIQFNIASDYTNWATTQPALSLKHHLHIIFDRLRGRIDKKLMPLAHLKHNKPLNISLILCLLYAQSKNDGVEKYIKYAYKLAGIDYGSNKSSSELLTDLTRRLLLMLHPSGELRRELGDNTQQCTTDNAEQRAP